MLIAFDPGYLAGWTVERHQIDLVAAAKRSRAQMDARLRQLCAAQVRATRCNLQVDASYRVQTFKHILMPVWLLTYTCGSPTYQVVANGVTGRMAGQRPWSWIKIALLIIVAPIALYLYGSSLMTWPRRRCSCQCMHQPEQSCSIEGATRTSVPASTWIAGVEVVRARQDSSPHSRMR